ncbi:MAG: NADH:flavin oxidoreductase [Promethearchaeota archaeon]
MSILFQSKKIGNLKIKNRFIRSSVVESMSLENGEVSDDLIKLYTNLAKGEIGLILTGNSYIHPLGRANKYQTGIYSDDMIPGLKKVVDAVHQEDGKIALQLVHAGLQTSERIIGTTPIAPSKRIRNPFTMSRPLEMNNDQINETIKAFGEAARRSFKSGADAIQIHAAHGYLINQFISSFYNRRKDDWGGSDENRFRFLKEVILECKQKIPPKKALLVKINSNDYTKKKGLTPPITAKYAKWLVDLGIDGLEISCGSSYFSMFNMCRGDVPVNEILQIYPDMMKPMAKQIFDGMVGKFEFQEPYNLEAAKVIKPALGDIPLILVGGQRKLSDMERIITNNHADFIAMARPFIREPHLIKSFKEGKKSEASCISCNRCLAAVMNELPINCYVNKFPEKK